MTGDEVRAANAMQEPPSHNLIGPAADVYEKAKRRVSEWDPFNGVTTELPPPSAEDALSFDEVEAAGLDGTLRSMIEHIS